MKVAFACHSEDWAGAESSLYALLRRLDPARHAPLALLPTNGRLSERLERLGVPLAYAATVPWIDQRGAGIEARFGADLEWRVEAFAERLRRAEARVVMTNSAVMLEGALAAHRLGLPHVWRIHEMLSRHDNLERALPLELYPRLVEALSDRALLVSEAVREDLAAADAGALEVVPNGLPPFEPSAVSRRARIGVDPSAPLIVFVGTLSEAKGVPLLAPILKRVRETVPDARCALVGRDVGGEAPLRRAIRRLGLGQAFSFLGFRDDAMEIIALADALVLPSRVDSLPCVVMEAMAAGVPPVATRSGGAAELIVDGETGYLAAIGDAEAMGDALARLLGDRAHASAVGAAARDRARDVYGLDRMVRAFEATFDRLAERRRAPDPEGSKALVGRLVEASGPSASATSVRAVEALLAELRPR